MEHYVSALEGRGASGDEVRVRIKTGNDSETISKLVRNLRRLNVEPEVVLPQAGVVDAWVPLDKLVTVAKTGPARHIELNDDTFRCLPEGVGEDWTGGDFYMVDKNLVSVADAYLDVADNDATADQFDTEQVLDQTAWRVQYEGGRALVDIWGKGNADYDTWLKSLGKAGFELTGTDAEHLRATGYLPLEALDTVATADATLCVVAVPGEKPESTASSREDSTLEELKSESAYERIEAAQRGLKWGRKEAAACRECLANSDEWPEEVDSEKYRVLLQDRLSSAEEEIKKYESELAELATEGYSRLIDVSSDDEVIGGYDFISLLEDFDGGFGWREEVIAAQTDDAACTSVDASVEGENENSDLSDIFNTADEVVTLTTPSASDLLNLDDFRADARFGGIDGSGFSVVIIDSGIDLDHSFFGPDSDSNGIADRIVYQYDFYYHDTDASDHNGHGTHVSSIVASEAPTYTGVAPDYNIIHLKVTSDDSDPIFSSNAIEEALQWVDAYVGEYNIASVNMSFGSVGTHFQTPQTSDFSDERAQNDLGGTDQEIINAHLFAYEDFWT